MDAKPVSAYRDEAVILQNGRFPIAQTFSNFPAFLAVQDHASKVWIHSMALVESQAILSHHIELPAKYRERFPVDTGMCQPRCNVCEWRKSSLPVGMARSMYIRPRLVDLGMNSKSRCVDRLVADYDLAVFVDQDEIAHANLREVSRQWVQPCRSTSVTFPSSETKVKPYKSDRSRSDRAR